MMSLTSTTMTILTTSAMSLQGTPVQRVQLSVSGLALPSTESLPSQHTQTTLEARRLRSRALICAAGLSARCAAEQAQIVQAVTGQSPLMVRIPPIQGKEKSPELDDGGMGSPPRDYHGGGGGGGDSGDSGDSGGGDNWPVGFFVFLGFLLFVGLLRDEDSEDPSEEN